MLIEKDDAGLGFKGYGGASPISAGFYEAKMGCKTPTALVTLARCRCDHGTGVLSCQPFPSQ